ncbi:MAG: hypothetical protein O7H40_04125 [Gammaproteobacteria bacterium]|nr:hypothetical protein [Gammaproteobacteria bacterium]
MKKLIVPAAILLLGSTWSASAATCDDLEFDRQARTAYAQIRDACLEVVELDGVSYAKFHARVVLPGNRPVVQFQHRDGSWGARTQVQDPNTMLKLSGRNVRLRNVNRGQEMNIYMPEGRWELAMTDEEVITPVTVAAVAPVAMAPEPMLPMTAGFLPLLGLGGAVSVMLAGLVAGIRRRKS